VRSRARRRSAAVPGGSLSATLIEEAAGAGYDVLMTSTPTVRLERVGAMLVHGRYTIWASTPARRAAAYASGQPWARATAWAGWQAKSAAKRVSPEVYETLRRRA
jgi:hypothetical protein